MESSPTRAVTEDSMAELELGKDVVGRRVILFLLALAFHGLLLFFFVWRAMSS
jgi:hypothetical protein